MQITRKLPADTTDSITITLTPEELRLAYEEQQLLYLTMDAMENVNRYREHIGIDLEEHLTHAVEDSFYTNLARIYLEKEDCNVDENSTWNEIILEHFAKGVLLPDFLRQIKNGKKHVLQDFRQMVSDHDPSTREESLETAMQRIPIADIVSFMEERVWPY